ncbi:hypothetical protein FOL46_000898 [Perkinsus olseni]|uniref:MYND-type domain-containing protein n=1 Tax=Perkinsus olseni TaxID=32597 RepID=A0A7J6MHB5_PEROL|nr:hypothetical protein FOL46_000898 [Perkinsus olseni]
MNGIPTPMPVDLSDMDKTQQREDDTTSGSESQKIVPKECSNCGRIPENPLRCGVCKKVVYCDRKCQKEDWRFHKRICKKPQPKKDPAVEAAEKKARQQRAAEKKTVEPFRSTKDDDVVVEDEKLYWYRHREWIPEHKQEFKPHEIDVSTAVEADAAEAGASSPQKIQATESEGHTGKSVWNTADTYEERNTTEWANDWLNNNLPGSSFDGPEDISVVVDSVNNLEGDAAIPIVRGTARYVYDYKFKLGTSVTFRGLQLEADITVDDFANDMEPYTFHVNVKDKQGVDRDAITTARSIIIKAIIPQFISKLGEFVTEYHKL